jgi:hypothetical protein
MQRNNVTDNSLTIILWNANGVSQRRQELEYLLRDMRIDVALLTETHLTSRSTFYIPGYTIYRADNPDDRAHGGAAILIRSNITQFPHPVNMQTAYLQNALATVKLQNIEITLAAVYCPPRHTITLEQFQVFFQNLGTQFIAGGDFNAKHQRWGSRLNNPRGRILMDAIMRNNFQLHSTDQPTYWPTAPTRIPDILDFFISRGINSLNPVAESLADLSSDHSPIQLTLNAIPVLKSQPESLTQGTMDWNSFRNFVSLHISRNISLKTPYEIEEAVDHLTSIIQTSAWLSATPKPKYHRFVRYPQFIRDLIREKRWARHRWQRSRLREDKLAFNRLTNTLRKEMVKFQTETRSKYLESLSVADCSLWKATKKIMKFNNTQSPLQKNGTWVKTDEGKAELFSTHLSSTFIPYEDVKDDNFVNEIEEYLSSPLLLSLPPEPFTLAQVKGAINFLPTKKSPGYDLITGEVLKELPEIGIRYITYLFNAILRTSHFPRQWKVAVIILVLKPGKIPHNPSSYRPISLLPVLSKLLERLLLPRVNNFFKDSIPSHQFGFKTKHSTIHQLQRVVDYAAESLETKKYCAGVFLDVNAAFDRVWHKGLLYKLKQVFSDSYYRLFTSFFEDRCFSVRQGQIYSSLQEINAGVPQGSILSPTFYNFYTSDLPMMNGTMIATYADDTAIMAAAEKPEDTSLMLQRQLDLFQDWLTRWRMKVNTGKSSQVTFSLRRRTCPPVTINGEHIPQANRVRYLGLILDRRITWREHIREKRKSLNKRLKILYPLLCKRSTVPLHQKLLIYKSILRPMWTYGLQLFGSAKKSNLRCLQGFESKVFRLITGAPSYVSNRTLYSDLKTNTIQEEANKCFTRYFGQLQRNSNELISQLSCANIPSVRRLRRSWNRDL